MKSSRWRKVLNHFSGLLLFAFIFVNALQAFAGPGKTTYQAKIVKPDGYPLEASSVNFKFTILDPAGSCILYSETYSSVNMSSTGGLISFALGSGVKTYPVSATTFEQVFSNITPSLSCDTGGPASYTPAASDIRKIVMQFHDGSGWQTLPAMSINAVPYAMYANEATKLNGLTSSDFVQVSTVPTCATSEALRYTGTGFTCVAVGSSVTSGTVISALGYTPADGASVTTLTSNVSSVSSTVASVSSTVFSVSSTVTSLQNSVAASFAAITSSQWTTSGTNIFYNTGNIGIGTTTPVTKLDVSGGVRIGAESTTCAPALAGTLRYNASNVEYCNGTSWQAFGVSGAGLQSFNGSTSGTQSFAMGTGGTAPNIVTANGVHTLNLPLASTGSVTAGLISNADYTTFSNKITSSAASIAQVLGYVPADNAASGTYAQKANNLSDLTNIATARTNLGLGTLAVGNSIDLGSASATGTLAIARLPSFTGDATIAAASNTIILSNSGVTAGTYTKVTVDTKGRVTSSSALASSDVITALGYTPANSATIVSSQWSTSGSTINYMTGNVGIGTTSANERLTVAGNINLLNPGASINRYISLATNGGGEKAYIRFDQTAAPGPSNYWDVGSLSGNNSYDFGFESSGTRRMTLTFGGNLGIGTTAPSVKTQISGTNNGALELLRLENADANGRQSIIGFKNVGLTNPTTKIYGGGVTNGGDGAFKLTLTNPSGTEQNFIEATNSSGTDPKIIFSTSAIERMRIDYLGNIGIGTTTPVTKLDVSGGVRIGAESTTCAPALAGTLRYNASNVEYCNGTSWQAFGVSSSGLTSLNGSTSQTQTFANATGGTAPNIVTANGVHTLNIPLASTGSVTAGLISNADYTTFTNKITSSAASIAQVLGYVPADNAASGTYALKANNLSDLTNVATARTNLGLGTFATASSIDLGSASATGTLAIARLPSFSGDATIAAASNTIILSNSGVTAGTYTKVTVDTKGRVTSSSALASSDVTTALGYTPASATASTQWTTSGTNIYYNTGNVGIGTSTPSSPLEILSNSATYVDVKGVGDTYTFSALSLWDSGTNKRWAVGHRKYAGETNNFYVEEYDGTSYNQRLVIKPGGSVGIGTTSPSYGLLDVNGGARFTVGTTNFLVDGTAASIFRANSTGGGGANIDLLHYNNGSGILANSVTGSVNFKGSNSSGVFTTVAQLSSRMPTVSAGSEAGTLVLSTMDNGLMSDRINITGGNVGIGTTTPSAKLHLAAGTSSTASVKFTSGTLLTSPQSGTIEYDGTNFYLTDSTNTRRAIAANTNPGTYDNVSNINSSSNITLTPTGSVVVSSTTASTNSSTGALVVKGGLGVAGDIYTSGTIVTSSNIQGVSVTATSGMITPYIYGSTVSGSALTLDSTTHANKGNILLAPNGGNVGIGTTAPQAKLSISNGGAETIEFYPGNGSGIDALQFYNRSTSAFDVARFIASDYRFETTGASEKMRITTTGNVGVGTSAPTTRLHVVGGNAMTGAWTNTIKLEAPHPTIQFKGTAQDNKTAWIAYDDATTTNGLSFWVNGSSDNMVTDSTRAMMIANTGNVGIGTTSPSRKLEVTGTAAVSDKLWAGYGNNNILGYSWTDSAFTTNSIEIVNNNGAVSGSSPTLAFHRYGTGGPQFRLDATGTNVLYLESSGPNAARNPNAYGGNSNSFFSRLHVDGGLTTVGNVGVGTTSPSYKLEAVTNSTAGFRLVTVNSTVGSPQIDLYDSGRSQETVISSTDGTTVGTYISSYSNHPLMLGTYSGNTPTAKMTILQNGNVGIGTTSPTEKLHVQGNSKVGDTASTGTVYMQLLGMHDTAGGSGFRLQFDRTNDIFGIAREWSGFQSPSFVIKRSDGNVGIGTTSPSEKLEVNGIIKGSAFVTGTSSYTLAQNAGDTWIRFASGVSNSFAEFRVSGSSSSQHGYFVVQISCNFPNGNTDTCSINMPHKSEHFYQIVKSIRIVRTNGTYDPYYVEFLLGNNPSTTNNVTVNVRDNSNFTIISPGIAGSIPAGYFAQSISVDSLKMAMGNGQLNITKDGNVGIGTTTPLETLHIAGTSSGSADQTLVQIGDPVSGSGPLYLTYNAPFISGNTYFNSGWKYGGGQGKPSSIGLSNGLAFYTADEAVGAAGAAANMTAKMTITSNGNVGIGTTAPGYTLHVVGTAGLSTGTAWTNASDIRLKDIQGDYEYGLNEILKLHTVRYNYKKGNALGLPSDFSKTGFIAQEVQKVIPDAVNVRKDGYLELNVDPIHWAVVNAVKDLYKLVVEIKNEILGEVRGLASIVDSKADKAEIEDLRKDNVALKQKAAEVDELKAENAAKSKEIDALKLYLCSKDPSASICK